MLVHNIFQPCGWVPFLQTSRWTSSRFLNSCGVTKFSLYLASKNFHRHCASIHWDCSWPSAIHTKQSKVFLDFFTSGCTLLCLSCSKKGDRFPWPAVIAQGVTGRETEFQMYSTADDLAELYPEISLLARIGRDITFTPIGESSATKFGMCNDLPISCHCFCTSTCHLKNWSFNPKSTPRRFSQVESGLLSVPWHARSHLLAVSR